MKINDFANQYDLITKNSVEKVALLAFYHLQFHSQVDFTTQEVDEWFDA